MRRRLVLSAVATAMLSCALAGQVLAGPAFGKAADNAIYAQKLVNEQMAKHPELLVLGLHAPKPGAKDSHMIAANLDRIGKDDDEDDLAVAQERKTILAPNMKEPDKFEVAVPLKDASGKVIGSLSTVFKYAAGDDEVKMHSAALAIRDEMARKIPSVAALFAPTTGAAGAAGAAGSAGPAEPLAGVRPHASIEIPASKGKFDFLRVDDKRHRLLAAHENDGTADYFDLATNKLISRVKVGGAVDNAMDPDSKFYYVSVQEEQRVAVLDAATLKEVKSIKVSGPTDAIIYEPKNHMVYVTHDEGANVWVIDPATAKVVASVDVPGVPEFMVYDAATDRIYLNIKSADVVAVIDPNTNKTIAKWSTAPATAPHGLALDAANHRIFSSGANGKLAVIDTGTGKVMTSVSITEKVDQIAFDPNSHLVYCAGPGKMSMVRAVGDSVTAVGDFATAATARNVTVDAKTGAVWSTFTDGQSSFAKAWMPEK